MSEDHTLKKDWWENALRSDTYFDCRNDYAGDLKRRFTDKRLTEITLAAIGNGKFFDLEKDGSEWSVLEIGCGYGLYGAHFCRFANEYIGVDISEHIVGRGNDALQKAGITNAKLSVVHNNDLSILGDARFDLVFTGAVFIHTTPDVTFSYLKQTPYRLKTDGKFLYHFYMDKTKSIHDPYSHFYRESELASMFEKAGLRILDVLDQETPKDHCFYPDKWAKYVYGGCNA